MAKKETLQKDSDVLIYGVVAVVASLLLTWLFINQFFFLSISQPAPNLEFKEYGVIAVFLGLGMAIVCSLYFLFQKRWRIFFAGISICCILFLFKDGEAYSPAYLYYLLDQYSYEAITNELYIWSLSYFFVTASAIFGTIKPRNTNSKGAHGTAVIQYGDDYAVKNFKMGGDGEVIIGKHKKTGRMLTYNVKRHVITSASTRSGKGTGSIIPNLLHYPFSAVVVDPKGENCNYTAEHRASYYNQKIICLDPFRESVWGKQNGTNHFNPLDLIPDTFQGAFRPCNALVNTIFADEIKADPFWSKRAKNLYRGFLMYICTAPEYNDPDHKDYSSKLRNLSTVNHLFSLPASDLKAYIENISVSDNPLPIKKFANEFLSAGASEKMLIGIMETLKGEIQLFHSPEISNIMSYSDFSFGEAIEKGTTIYLIVSPEELQTYAKWTRIILTMLIQRTIYERKKNMNEAMRENIIFLLDEFTNLGRLDIVKDNYSIAGGYGIKFWIIFQDISQLKFLYKKSWSSFFSNADIVQVFGVGDIETADYFSRALGETTIVSTSKSRNKGSGFRSGGGKGTSRSEQKRRLYNPDEVMRLPENLQFVFISGEHPIMAKKVVYYKDKTFKDITPSRISVFTKLMKLPSSFDVVIDNVGLEHKIRTVIFGKKYADLSSDDDTKGSTTELSIDFERSNNIEKDGLGDGFDLSPFR